MKLRVWKRPTGTVCLARNGTPIWRGSNLVVNAGLSSFARLAGGSVSGQSVAAIGYGSGNAAPTVADTDLFTAPKYYNAVGPATYPSPGTVTFAFALTSADYGAYALTIQEIGLYANAATVMLPGSSGFTHPGWLASSPQPIGNLIQDLEGRTYRSALPPSWEAAAAVSIGQLLTDPNGNLQQCATGGVSGETAPVAWGTAIGGATSDGSVGWVCAGLTGYQPTTGTVMPIWSTSAIGQFTWDGTVAWQLLTGIVVPGPMIAHATVPAFTFGGAVNYSGSWSLTF